MFNVIVGIDVGTTGALASLNADTGKLIAVFDMPIFSRKGSKRKFTDINEFELAKIIEIIGPRHAVVEHVSAMPGQGVSSVFGFGESFGLIKGTLAGMGIPFTLVRPNIWKKHFRLGSDKSASRQMASRLFPDMADSFKRVKDDGRAEAALIAKFHTED